MGLVYCKPSKSDLLYTLFPNQSCQYFKKDNEPDLKYLLFKNLNIYKGKFPWIKLLQKRLMSFEEERTQKSYRTEFMIFWLTDLPFELITGKDKSEENSETVWSPQFFEGQSEINKIESSGYENSERILLFGDTLNDFDCIIEKSDFLNESLNPNFQFENYENFKKNNKNFLVLNYHFDDPKNLFCFICIEFCKFFEQNNILALNEILQKKEDYQSNEDLICFVNIIVKTINEFYYNQQIESQEKEELWKFIKNMIENKIKTKKYSNLKTKNEKTEPHTNQNKIYYVCENFSDAVAIFDSDK